MTRYLDDAKNEGVLSSFRSKLIAALVFDFLAVMSAHGATVVCIICIASWLCPSFCVSLGCVRHDTCCKKQSPRDSNLDPRAATIIHFPGYL